MSLRQECQVLLHKVWVQEPRPRVPPSLVAHKNNNNPSQFLKNQQKLNFTNGSSQWTNVKVPIRFFIQGRTSKPGYHPRIGQGGNLHSLPSQRLADGDRLINGENKKYHCFGLHLVSD